MGPAAILILDEIQKIENWSEIIKKLWDESIRSRSPIKVLLLGSSSLALQTGLSESLSGRFELIRAYHWNFLESREAFGYSLDDYLCFGGYPGAHPFKNDVNRWLEFLRSSIVETVLEKDIARLRRIARPALFRQVFELLCTFPAAELSLRKLVGQLQDPGSMETIKHYIELMEGAFLVKTLQKYSTNPIQKKSSPLKILPLCPALCTFARGEVSIGLEERGRLFELIVGCDLLRLPGELFYWRSDQWEVDYVYKVGRSVTAIEVKSGRRKSPHGLIKFKTLFESAAVVMITPENYLEFTSNPGAYITAHRA
ncbi:MAG: AAA family ATPase [Pseudomonadota bacterium]